MQLGVLVDRMVDPREEPFGREVGDMVLEVKRRLRVLRASRLRRHDVIHAESLLGRTGARCRHRTPTT